ncbi:MAG: hypothetical protein PVF49_01405 [Anaerolineales bacterium]|jgi:hypothetical protein
MRLEITQRWPQITILHHLHSDGSLWGTAGRTILKRPASQGWTKVAQFPFIPKRDLMAVARPLARALRADKANLYVNRRGKVLGIRSSTAYAIAERAVRPLFSIQGDSVLHGGLCEDSEGAIYFGEYFMNPARQPVRIWRVAPDGSGGEVAYTFPAGQIRHVHGIYPDPYDPGAMWVASGDYQGENYLWRTQDGFAHLERFGDGEQIWRAVRLFFTPDHICWLTDSHLETNHACRMSRRDSRLEIGQSLGAPAWYGTSTSDGWHLAFTTVEPGPAVTRNDSAMLASRDAFEWQEIASWEKDIWRPMKVFKYGVISCPSGSMTSANIYLSGEGLRGLDGASLEGRIVESTSP